MYKVIRMVRRRKDLTLAQFKSYWLNNHINLERRAMEMSPMRKIVATFSTGEVAMGAKEPPFDGMVSLYFNSLDDIKNMFSGPVPPMMLEDEKNFVDLSEGPLRTINEEYLMSRKDGSVLRMQGQLKVVRTVYRRKDLTPVRFKKYWLENHAKLEEEVIATTGCRRIVASFALPESIEGKEPAFDGMAELYFDTVEDIRATFAGPVPAMMRKDEENFVQMDAPAIRNVCEEYVLFDEG